MTKAPIFPLGEVDMMGSIFRLASIIHTSPTRMWSFMRQSQCVIRPVEVTLDQRMQPRSEK